jgi:hypothetical protein
MIIDNISNENTVITLIKEFFFNNYKQVFLLILVFIIIFIVEYITYLNSILYGITQIPGINMAPQQPAKEVLQKKQIKKRKI